MLIITYSGGLILQSRLTVRSRKLRRREESEENWDGVVFGLEYPTHVRDGSGTYCTLFHAVRKYKQKLTHYFPKT